MPPVDPFEFLICEPVNLPELRLRGEARFVCAVQKESRRERRLQ